MLRRESLVEEHGDRVSYDYLLFRPQSGFAAQAAVDDGRFDALGSLDELAARISAILPSVQWKPSTIQPTVRTGGPAPSFLLNAEADGQVHSFTMSRATEEDVRALARALGLSTLDMQDGEVLED